MPSSLESHMSIDEIARDVEHESAARLEAAGTAPADGCTDENNEATPARKDAQDGR